MEGPDIRHGRMILEGIDGVVCDMDGVLYRGDEAIPGAAGAIAELRRRGVRVLLSTNNSRSTVRQYVAKLARLGIAATDRDVLTSAVVTGEELAASGVSGAAIVVGGSGIREEVAAAGLTIDDDPHATIAAAVVVGWDPGFDFVAMRRAALAVRAGARFIATNDDAAFPAPGGQLWPGAGAILASIEVASGRRAEVMGKPYDPMMDAAQRRLAGASKIAVIGDRPETDLHGGRRRDWRTVLVLTGVTDVKAARALREPPDAVVPSIADLV